MNKPIPSSKPKTASGSGSGSGAGSSSNPKTAPADGGLGDWLSAPGPPKSSSEGASKPRALPRLEDAEASSAKTRTAPDDDEIQPAKKQKTGTGLEAALSAAKGEVAPNTLERTKAAWKDFKKDADDEVEEELEKYKKGKERYTDRVAFLGRVGRREWEVEQDGKKKR